MAELHIWHRNNAAGSRYWHVYTDTIFVCLLCATNLWSWNDRQHQKPWGTESLLRKEKNFCLICLLSLFVELRTGLDCTAGLDSPRCGRGEWTWVQINDCLTWSPSLPTQAWSCFHRIAIPTHVLTMSPKATGMQRSPITYGLQSLLPQMT